MKLLKNNIVKIIYIFILVSPILDSIAYCMREILHLNFSISTILKPAIMGLVYLLLMIEFIFYKKQKRYYLIPMVLVVVYAMIHLLLVKNMFFSFSYSTFTEEIKKMIQIIYLVLLICNFVILYQNQKEFNFDKEKLIKVLAISGILYYCIYFISLVTGTSEPMYANGVNLGYQGWFIPSHLINHIGSLTIPLMWLQYKKSGRKIWGIFTLIACGLCFAFTGTKSGSFSILIILFLLALYEFISALTTRDKKNITIGISLFLFLIGCIVAYRYTYTYKNIYVLKSDLEKSEGTLSEKVSRLVDSVEKESTTNPEVGERKKYHYNVEKSLLHLKDITSEKKLSGADNRTNELLYNSNLFFRSSLKYKIFGIGFSNQPNHLYMENDIFSLLFNFGILTFLFIYLPFLLLFIWIIIRMMMEFIKGKLNHFGEEYILLVSISLFMFLTYTTGYMMLQTSLIILYVPIFIHCFDLLYHRKSTISLKMRIRKYMSKIVRLKDKKSYLSELRKRDQLEITDYHSLAQDMPVSHYEMSKDNTLYGIVPCLREYASYKGMIDSYTEHGVNFSTSVYPKEAVSGLSNVITISKRRIDMIQKHYDKKVYAIGPFIHYASPLFDEKKYQKDKKKFGKVLLVFPSKSIEGVNHSFDSDEFIEEIKKIKSKVKADTVLVNIYYYDIQQGMQKRFEEEGFTIVTAGHKHDIHFTSRLKYIISLADYTMSNNIGTHIGYCLYMGKPHYVFKQKVEISGRNAKEEFYEERRKTYDESQKEIVKAFSEFAFEMTDTQKQVYVEHWDPESIKTKEELLNILKDSEY